MRIKGTLTGTEVPITGSDSINWIEITAPSSTSIAVSSSSATTTVVDADTTRPSFAPLTEDRASCSVIGDPPSYIIRRINKSVPHVLELLEFSASGEFPKNGFRIVFPDALSPFTFICSSEADSGQGGPYLLYALTVSGVAFVFKLRKISSYLSSSSPLVESGYEEFDIRAHVTHGVVTSVAAVTDNFLVGTDTGSVFCLKLGSLTPTSPGFVHELRDDAGIGRIWGFMSRSKTVGAVQDLVISEILGKKLVFALHSDGILRVWDLSHHNKVMNHVVNVSTFAGAMLRRLWISDANLERNIYTLAVLSSNNSEGCGDKILVFGIEFDLSEKIMLSAPHSLQNIDLEGRCIDVHVSSDKLTILKDNGLVSYNLFPANENLEEPQYYALQEEFVADQLYQGSEHFPKDLLLITQSILPSLKDKNAPSVSSMFLRRLLQPGIFHVDVFRVVMLDYNRHLNDSEMRSLTVGGLKNEILSVTEHEVLNQTPISTFYKWKTFCTRYFDYWCKNNAPLGLLLQPQNGAIVLIRKSSVSLFRSMEMIEQLAAGSDEVTLVSLGLSSSDDGFQHEILLEVLGCINCISQQLGKAASAVFYELLISTPTITSGDLLPSLIKILETGYSSSLEAAHVLDDRSDIAWEKELTDQKKLRKFSADMLLSLQNLSCKAGKWERVLEVVEGYIKFLVPNKAMQDFDSNMSMSINTSIIVQSTSQIASSMFESALDVLLFLGYVVHLNGQINMSHDDVSRVQFELVPMIQEIISEWLIIHFLATTSTESHYVEDFSYQLSSLRIDGHVDKRSWSDRHGKRDFTLAILLLLSSQSSSEGRGELSHGDLLGPEASLSAVRKFISWIIRGKVDESSVFLSHTTEIAMILIRHGQYNAAQVLIGVVEGYACKEHTSRSLQDAKGEWCILQHLLGCALLAQGRGLHGSMKEIKEGDAVCCFFRASSGEGSSQALLKLSHETGIPLLGFSSGESPVVLKLHYYQWAMQMFEQHNVFEGACHFALAALEQVDEVLHYSDSGGREVLNESEIAIKGRLWANVFKFTLDLNNYYDAYCAIISNPDEESKHICLRRFIIVLYDRGVSKILCNGQLPFIGLTEKVERELFWKAERSDIMMKQNPYKLLYAFEMHRQNWRKAASYLYRFTFRLRKESNLKEGQKVPMVILERLNVLSAAINALHLVHPLYAWIDPPLDGSPLENQYYPSKKAKTAEEQTVGDYIQPHGSHSYIDIEKLEKEFVLTSAEYLLHLANIRWSYSNVSKLPGDLVDLLVQTGLYDMAFTVVLKFFKASDLKRELERVFTAMSLKCCPSAVGSPLNGNERRLLLTSSRNETSVPEMGSPPNPLKGNSHWENLELYLGKYKDYHGRLPVIVGETLLRADCEIELPLWLVHMFKGNKKERSWGGMATGEETNAASLFQLYVDYGRYTEATNVLLEYMNAFAAVRPSQLRYRKRPCSAWFPYTAVERLWSRLEESIGSGHLVEQSKKLQSLLGGALSSHLKQIKLDSQDAISFCQQQATTQR